MKYALILASLCFTMLQANQAQADCTPKNTTNECVKTHSFQKQSYANQDALLKKNSKIHISVVGQGVAPTNTISPAQAYALAKRAAIADGYRSLAEKLRGVRVEGQDDIKNMMMQKSTVRTQVEAIIRDANIVETQFKDGLCEVEMEVELSYSDFL
ncbi:MAG: LPP20 family lipoprotein [Sulfurimonas sp.]|jgi:hypothetical protein|nr:LPP20 family lipoprotein [Sulfurimonadaceae bacterium]